MRKIFFLLFISFFINASAQNNDYLISMDGIGSIKLGMKQNELEKLLNRKIPLTNPWDTISGSWQDSAYIRYKNIDLRLDFQRNYFAADTFNMMIIGIETKSPLCKTENGIEIGSDKLKIITAYENYEISLMPEYDDEDYSIKSKSRSIVNILNETRNRMITFSLTNKRVTAFKVRTSFSDEE